MKATRESFMPVLFLSARLGPKQAPDDAESLLKGMFTCCAGSSFGFTLWLRKALFNRCLAILMG